MTKKERCAFKIKLTIREESGKITELNETIFLEITWEGNKGILNPSEVKEFKDRWSKDFGIVKYRVSEGEKIRLKKDGKSYDIIVKINEIKKGWSYDRITDRRMDDITPAPGSNFTIIREYEWSLKPIQRRGLVLTRVILFFALLLIIIIIIYFYKKEKKQR